MGQHDVFWVDDDYDREHARLGAASRYGQYVEGHAGDFDDVWGDISPVTFACTAWRLAASPFLEPGYVRAHRRVLFAQCVRNSWDGTLLASVTAVSPWPTPLTRDRTWAQDRGWRDWPEVIGQYVPPSARDLSRSPHLRSTVLIETSVPLDHLPPVPDEKPAGAGQLVELAQRAVRVLVNELNGQLLPVFRALEG